MALSNYPDGMSTGDLMHVGEMEPDWCEDCYCENPDERDLLTEDGEGCFHLEAQCDCKRCDCDCHRDNEPDEPDFDPLGSDTSEWL